VSLGVKYLVHASYLEIYNEEIRDLLGKDVKHKLDLKEHPDRGVYVQGMAHAAQVAIALTVFTVSAVIFLFSFFWFLIFSLSFLVFNLMW